MELNLLLLPLLGGYYFYTHFNGTAYAAAHCSNQRLLFGSAISGLVLLLLGRMIWLSNEYLQAGDELAVQILGIATAAVPLALILSTAELAWEIVRPESPKAADPLKAVLGILLLGVFAFFSFSIWRRIPGDPLCTSGAIVAVAALVFSITRIASSALESTLIVPAKNIATRVLLAAAGSTMLLLMYVGYYRSLEGVWLRFSPYDYSATALFAFVLGVFLPRPLNALIFRHAAAIHRLYKKNKISAMEKLFYESMNELKQVQLTLDDGKVYTGWINDILPELSQIDPHVSMLPLRSGFRKSDTKEVVWKTSYDDIYELLVDKYKGTDVAEIDARINEFSKLVPLSKIVIAGKFDDEAADLFASAVGPPRKEDMSPDTQTGSIDADQLVSPRPQPLNA